MIVYHQGITAGFRGIATYRGIELSDRLRAVIPYMAQFEETRAVLTALVQRWDLLDALGRVMDARSGARSEH